MTGWMVTVTTGFVAGALVGWILSPPIGFRRGPLPWARTHHLRKSIERLQGLLPPGETEKGK
jgi:hypothetical protein